jgi:hypothetical protein
VAYAQKNAVKPWLKQQWCIPAVDAEFVWRMEDVLALYAAPYDARFPAVGSGSVWKSCTYNFKSLKSKLTHYSVVCFDECP